jgi:hypothetical protein
MHRTPFCAVILLALLAGAAAAAPTTKVCGLRVVAPGYGEETEGVRAFNQFPGTTLALLVTLPDGGLIDFVREESKLEKFVDDTGVDLRAARGRFGGPQITSGSHMFSGDNTAAVVEIRSPGLPGEGAKQLTVEGVIALRCAAGKKTATQKDVKVAPGSKIEAGDVAFTLVKTGKPDWGEEPLQITLKSRQDCTEIAGFRFLDADGSEIKHTSGGGYTMSGMGTFDVEKKFNLAREVDTMSVEITYWVDCETVKAPFKITTSLGL